MKTRIKERRFVYARRLSPVQSEAYAMRYKSMGLNAHRTMTGAEDKAFYGTHIGYRINFQTRACLTYNSIIRPRISPRSGDVGSPRRRTAKSGCYIALQTVQSRNTH
jgi:hypothetical protein